MKRKEITTRQIINEAITFGLFLFAIGTLTYLEWLIKAGG